MAEALHKAAGELLPAEPSIPGIRLQGTPRLPSGPGHGRHTAAIAADVCLRVKPCAARLRGRACMGQAITLPAKSSASPPAW